MPKILEIALKEISLIKAQRIAIVLILLYPLIIVLALLMAFGGPSIYGSLLGSTSMDQITIATYMPGESLFFDYDGFFGNLNESDKINIIAFDSKESVKNAVVLGEAELGVIIDEPKTSGDTLKVNMFYDNTAPLVASNILFMAESNVKQIGSQAAESSITEIWGNLESIQRQIYSERQKLDGFIYTLKSSNFKIKKLQKELASIEFTPLIQKIGSAKASLDSYDNEVDLAKTEISNSKGKLLTYEQELTDARTELLYYRANLVNINELVVSAKNDSIEPLTSQLQEIENSINDEITKIDGTINKMDSAQEDIDNVQQSLVEANRKLDLAKSDLDEGKIALEELSGFLLSVDSTLGNAKGFIAEALELQENSVKDLESTRRNLSGFLQTISSFRDISPETLVQPIEINSHKLFEARNLDIMLVMSIVVVLLLITMLLTGVSTILEREQGMAFRARLSSTGKLTWIIGKIIGQIFFVMIISTLILSISVFLIGMPMAGSILDLGIALMLIPFSFICMSLFITRFTNTFSATVLASLLIIIPMLLLGGILFPIEFMPELAALFSNLLPLTVAKNLLMNIMIKGLPITHLTGDITVLLSYSLLFLAIYMPGKRI